MIISHKDTKHTKGEKIFPAKTAKNTKKSLRDLSALGTSAVNISHKDTKNTKGVNPFKSVLSVLSVFLSHFAKQN